MTDTQWPRFEVFLQGRPGRPHEYAGSVHAPDPEMALLNARDVFVRRPECSSLWVVPAAAVHGGTAEQLEAMAPGADGGPTEIPFLVFAKLDQRGTLVHDGEVSAGNASAALARAWSRRPRGAGALVIWVAPTAAVMRSQPDDAAPMFSPAADKSYRDQAHYHVQTALRQLRRRGGG